MDLPLSPFGIAVVVIAVLSALGAPIGLSMIGASVVYLWVSGQDIGLAAEQVLQGLYNSFTLLAIPLFILAASLMNVGSLSDRLLSFCLAVVGRFRGGLGHVNVFSSLIFSGMSGSAVADAVGVGRLITEMMTKAGRYTPSYAAAITAATACIGPIVPPSIPMVLYALVAEVSVGHLFLAGFIPGLLMAAVMAGVNSWMARRRNFPVEEAVPLRELPGVTWRALPALMMPVVLLGGIYGGVMTPTEAAAVAAGYALLAGWLLRSIALRDVWDALRSSARSTASVGVLIAGALVFNYVVTRENIPDAISVWLQGFQLTQVQFLLLINVLLLVLGCLLDASTILLVIVPILIPAAQAMGVDLVHFGLVVVMNLMIGLITPPYGILLFVMAGLTRSSLLDIVRDLLPFLVALIGALFFLTFVPDLVLWLPRLFGYGG